MVYIKSIWEYVIKIHIINRYENRPLDNFNKWILVIKSFSGKHLISVWDYLLNIKTNWQFYRDSLRMVWFKDYNI